MSNINRMDLREFKEKGFLQEANRKFFHPIGLALEVIIEDTGEVLLGGVWDYSEDVEGLFFAPDIISKGKINYVENLRQSKLEYRKNNKYENTEVDENGIQQL